MEVNIFSVIERVKKIKNVLTDAAVARELDMSRENLNGYKQNGTIPYAALLKLAEDEGLSADFILYGRHALEDYTPVKKYKQRLNGGPGAYVLDEDVESTLLFKTPWLTARCNRNSCGMFEVSGDSMSPAICHGDIVLVDMSHLDPNEIIDSKTYAFSELDKVRIKLLFWKDGKLNARSKNENENQGDGPVDLEGFRLIGRVIWVGHEVR